MGCGPRRVHTSPTAAACPSRRTRAARTTTRRASSCTGDGAAASRNPMRSRSGLRTNSMIAAPDARSRDLPRRHHSGGPGPVSTCVEILRIDVISNINRQGPDSRLPLPRHRADVDDHHPTSVRRPARCERREMAIPSRYARCRKARTRCSSMSRCGGRKASRGSGRRSGQQHLPARARASIRYDGQIRRVNAAVFLDFIYSGVVQDPYQVDPDEALSSERG